MTDDGPRGVVLPMPPRRLMFVTLTALALAACLDGPGEVLTGETGETGDGDPPAGLAVALVDAGAWSSAPLASDPLAAHQPEEVVCLPGAWVEEFGVLEASTETCNYLSLEQPLAAGLEAGDRVAIELWWAALLAPEPAAGHLALLVDGELLWETWVEIPAKADARRFEFASPISAEPGARVIFHLHNHGQNTWTLATVERLE